MFTRTGFWHRSWGVVAEIPDFAPAPDSPNGLPTGLPGIATCRTVGGIAVVTLMGEFDADSRKELDRVLGDAARTGTRTVVDCTHVTFADLALLHACHHCDLTLAGPLPHPLTTLLEAAPTTSHRFTIAADLPTALSP